MNTEPTGARAYVDGKLVGETPVRVTSTPGPHDLKLLLDGYIGRSSKVTLPSDSGFELRVAVGLKRVRGFERLERPDPLLLARAQVTRGLACYRLGDFPCALAAYRAAYEMKPIPDLLFNIAQTERKIGHLENAITAYKAFLAEKTTGNVATVARQHLAECEAALAKGEKLADDSEGTGPTLAHDPITHAPRGKDLPVTVVAKANKAGLGTVQVCYRAVLGDFQCVPLVKNDASAVADQFTATIPAASVQDGLAYYVEAFDADNAQKSHSGDKVNPLAVKMDEEQPTSVTVASSAPPAPTIAVISEGPHHRVPPAVPLITAGAAALSMGLGGVFYAQGKNAAAEVTAGAHTNAQVQSLTNQVNNDQWRANFFLGLGIALAAGAAALLVWDNL
jgi:tetratricopeptide (TPR) repeat protein